MKAILIFLTIQGLLGGFDNLWHHEIKERLPSKVSARGELTLHAIRELSYGVVFCGLVWFEWHGAWAWVLAGMLIMDVAVTVWDFLVEDRTRKLPGFERALHTVLTLNFGIVLALIFPILLQWAKHPTGFTGVNYGVFTTLLTLFGIGVFLWGIRNVIAVMALTLKKVPEWQRKPVKRGTPKIRRRILVTGGTGFIGSHLVRMFVARGHSVWVLSRDRGRVSYRFGPHVQGIEDLNEIPGHLYFDSIINLAGERIIGPPWTKARKALLIRSRTETTLKVLNLIRRLDHKPEALITASAIGYYRADKKHLNESNGNGDDFPALLCRKTEALALAARQEGVRVVPLRIGLVLGCEDGFLFPFLQLAKFSLAPVFGTGGQWLSWIHIEDLKDLVLFILHNENIRGPANATAPAPATQREFVDLLSKKLDKRRWVKIPEWPLRNILGEMSGLFFDGQHVVPKKALTGGFRFRFPILDAALDELVGKPVRKEPKGECAVFYNEECPVCRSEIGVYRKSAGRNHLAIRFHDINREPEALEAYGLGKDDIRRRLYTLTQKGQLVSGADAFMAIWKDMPGWRWGERLMRIPPVYFLMSFIYEGWMVPVLWRCNSETGLFGKRKKVRQPVSRVL